MTSEAPATEATPATAATPAAAPVEEDAAIEPRPADDEDGTDSALGDDFSSFTSSLTSSIMHYRTVNGRTYHSDRTPGTYFAANDNMQSQALDIQHHVLTLVLGGKLHLAPLPDTIQEVIDVGTGTGIWAIDFGDLYPEATVTGFDLSPIQPEWVPPNVKFLVDDFTLDWVTDKAADFIHLRWLVGSVPDWNELFKKAYACLKPGGWIESFDCDNRFDSDDDTVNESTALYKYGVIFKEGPKKIGFKNSFNIVSDDLQKKALEAAGFVNINEKSFKVPSSGWPKDPKQKEIGLFARAALNDIEGLIGLFANAAGWSKEEIAVLAAQLRKELNNPNFHPYYRSKIVWAQKPLE